LVDSLDDTGEPLPPEFAGKWIAWDDNKTAMLAVADTFGDLMKIVGDNGWHDVTIERGQGVHPEVAKRRLELLPDEPADLLEDIRQTIPNADEWLDTPNSRLWCEKPRDLLQGPREEFVRSLLRGIRSGITS
jgi:hypothetical protein